MKTSLVSRIAVLASAFAFSALAAMGQSGLVISQVYGGGGNSSATYNADFIELYNPTSSAISTSGLSVQYASAAGAFTQAVPLSATTIQPGHFFLVQTTTPGSVGVNLPTPDTTASSPNLSATAGKVALVNITSAISGDTTCALILADTRIIDFVGYGSTASCSPDRAMLPARLATQPRSSAPISPPTRTTIAPTSARSPRRRRATLSPVRPPVR